MSELNQTTRTFEADLPEEIVKVKVIVNDELNTADIISTGKFRNDHLNLREMSATDINKLILIFQETAKIIEEELVVTTTFIQKPATVGSGDGIIEVEAAGGVAPYTYSWSNGQETARIENLNSGTFVVDVTDYFGSTTQLSIELESQA